MRRQGIGTSLVKNVTHLGTSYFRFEWINAEVWEGCPAIPVLQKLGYEEVAVQEKYVKTPEGTYLARHLLQANAKEKSSGK